jgi:hypothetical protein
MLTMMRLPSMNPFARRGVSGFRWDLGFGIYWGFGLWALGFIAGCSSVPPLENTRGSAMDLATAVLSAFERKDEAALDALALNEMEFRDHVWPELPAARPERNLPFSYVWGDLRQKSGLRRTMTLADHGGRHYELLGVAFDGRTAYESYRVHRDTTFRVRDAAGAERELRLIGSMIEKDGAWKVFSYVADD